MGESATESPMESPVEKILRGEINATTQMEALEKAFLSAVVAAAGCTLTEFNIDDGIDAMIKHRAGRHLRSCDQFLQAQLKSTQQVRANPKHGQVAVSFSNDRFKLLAEPDPTIKKIVVIMIVPENVEEWVLASHDCLKVRHCAYWVNIAGREATGANRTVVNAPTNKIFDDQALCAIMERVGQGGYP